MNSSRQSGPLRRVDVGDVGDIALGAALLGTGGGGDPYIGRLLAASAMRQCGPVDIVAPEDLADDAFVACAAMMGAPTVIVEKLPTLAVLDAALDGLEQRQGRAVTALLPAEMGGINSLMPLALAARRRLPLVDADGMGRAFPELQMVTFNLAGHGASPLVMAADTGERVVIEAATSAGVENLARSAIVALGGSAAITCYSMSGAAARACVVAGTLTCARAFGRAIREGRSSGDPLALLLRSLSQTPHYAHHAVLARGKVRDLSRRIEGGFTQGRCVVQGAAGGCAIEFRNEYLVAESSAGATLCSVPDLIAVLDEDSAEPLTTDQLKYGQRVIVLGMSAPAALRTPAALEVMGPAAFGFRHPFVPLERLHPHA